MEVSAAFIVENVITAFVIVLYLGYEIHFGRLSRLAGKIDEVIFSVIALARASPGVDEEAVVERLNGHSPSDLLRDNFDEGEDFRDEREERDAAD